MALIAIGLVALLLAAAQRRRDLKAMKSLYPDAKKFSMAATVGVLVAGLAVLAIVLLLLRV